MAGQPKMKKKTLTLKPGDEVHVGRTSFKMAKAPAVKAGEAKTKSSKVTVHFPSAPKGGLKKSASKKPVPRIK